jgi:hypothetical protein
MNGVPTVTDRGPIGRKPLRGPAPSAPLVSRACSMLAKRIDMDPLELRLKNATRPGTQTVYGPKMSHDGYAETFLQPRIALVPSGARGQDQSLTNHADPQPAFRSAIRCFGPLLKRLECSRAIPRCEDCLASQGRMGVRTSNCEFASLTRALAPQIEYRLLSRGNIRGLYN